MSRGTVYQTRQQHAWDTTSQDYHAHLSMLTRTPSALPDVPQYPNVHKVFNNRSPQEESQKQKPNKASKKVQVTEQVQIIEQDLNGQSEVVEENINVEAEDFIQQKQKKFQLHKWKTFKFP